MKHSFLRAVAFEVSRACSSTGTDSTARAATISPSVTLITETLTGTVPVGGSDAHNVVLSQICQLHVTLTVVHS